MSSDDERRRITEQKLAIEGTEVERLRANIFFLEKSRDSFSELADAMFKEWVKEEKASSRNFLNGSLAGLALGFFLGALFGKFIL